MIRSGTDTAPLTALRNRLRAVSGALAAGPLHSPGADPAQEAMDLLETITESVKAQLTPDRVWLLSTAVSAVMPTSEQVIEGMRCLRLVSPRQASLEMLKQAVGSRSSASAGAGLRLVSDRIVVDVDHSARHDLHTGVQQVVRNVVPFWVRRHGAMPVAWNHGFGHYRALSGAESLRALRRSENGLEVPAEGSAGEMIVPWRTPVLLAEVPPVQACDRLSALARFSANPTVLIGYDCIPVVSADLVPDAEAPRFVRYLSIVKFARRVAAISDSARAEFAGFTGTLAAQGLAGPEVIECALPTAELSSPYTPEGEHEAAAGPPLVLSVGSFEPRKNHLSLLYAAERLWREGCDFQLLLLGGSGWGHEIPNEIAKLRRRGRRVEARHRVSDDELASAYQRADFTVFTSLHEGYGLPVAESLAHGTPVITSDHGSTRGEIAEYGGAILVDPRDDEQLVRAMRQLLSDGRRLASLRDEIARRPRRSWEEYAGDVWDRLVAPDLGSGPKKDRP